MQVPALLCESCGYPIESLIHTPAAKCPECGLAVASSLPSARPGTTWQQPMPLTARPWAWLRTNVATLFHPARTFQRLAIRPGRSLLWLNLLLAAAFLVDPWVGVLVGDPARNWQTRGAWGLLIYGGAWLAELLAGFLFLFALTWVEVAGVRFFAARRGWRLHKHAAWQIAAHASVGWILMAWLQLMGLAISTALVYWFGYSPKGTLDWPILSRPMPMTFAVSGAMAILGLVLGLLIFESLVYIGVRACRYANHADTPLPSVPEPSPARILQPEAPSPAA